MGSLTKNEATSLPMSTTDDETKNLLSNLAKLHTKPLWAQMAKLNPPLPNPKTIPYIWKYDEIRPHLLKAGELITEKQAERRVAMLINPARDAPFTTDTIYAGLQLVMPNEVAPAHRHTAFAMRFIIEGQGGFTAVQGTRINMTRGDVILTPTWNWHDHGNDASGPMIWLDGLDLPNFVHFPVHFVEHYDKPRYPAVEGDKEVSPIIFSWAKMKAQLDAEEGNWAARRYRKADGSEVSKILGGAAERINEGESSPAAQETSSSVYHVVEGSGHSKVGDKTLTWKQGDTFCIPAWYEYQHFADKGETVYLFRFDDQPMLKALGFYRVGGVDVESLVCEQ